jgi:hypothetical protein
MVLLVHKGLMYITDSKTIKGYSLYEKFKIFKNIKLKYQCT